MCFARLLVKPQVKIASIIATILLVTIATDYFAVFRPLLAASSSAESSHVSELTVVSQTETSNTYQNTDGSYSLVASTSRLNYKVDRTWKAIDNRIVSTTEDGYSYRNAANSFTVFAGATAEQGVRFCYLGECMDMVPAGGADISSVVKVSGSVISYSDVYPCTDWEIVIGSDGYENSLVVRSAEAVQAEYAFAVSAKSGGKIEVDSSGRIKAVKNESAKWQTSSAVVTDSLLGQEGIATSLAETTIAGQYTLVLKVPASFAKGSGTVYPIRIDPSLSVSVLKDTFVSPSTLNPANGTRRGMFIGRYTDYTLPSTPTFDKSRSLMDFGTLALPAGAIVSGAYVSLWHYGTNSSNTPAYITRITSTWTERTIWPGPGSSGDYGSYTFPYYNSDTNALRRDLSITDLSLVDSLRVANNGIMIRNYNETGRGEVVCTKEIPSGPCASGEQPRFTVNYTLNQVPNPPELSRPGELWEFGPKNNGVYPGVTCDNSGTGLGCSVEFYLRTEDPDDTFPLSTENVLDNGNGSSSFVLSQAADGWIVYTEAVNDGRWTWKARTKDRFDVWGNWSVERNFLVDTTRPTVANMLSEPEYSPGLQNEIDSTVSTDALYGQVAYQFQVATDPLFSSVVDDSGWISANSFVFGNLADEVLYYYRVRSKDGLDNVNGWGSAASSTQDATFPVVVSAVVDPVRISPKNSDGRFDTAGFNYDINEQHFSTAKLEVVNTEGVVLRLYTGISQGETVEIDGKDDAGNWLLDGFYSLRLTTSDLAGNVTINEDAILAIDNSSAVLNVSRPVNGAWFNYSPVEVSGITDSDATLQIANNTTGESKSAGVDPSSGIFSDNLGVIPGENSLWFQAEDPVGNISDMSVNVLREDVPPVVNAILPEVLVNDNTPVVTVLLQDYGYTDEFGTVFTSGIDDSKANLELQREDGSVLVLVSAGVNIHPELGHIVHDCDVNLACIYQFVFDTALNPDGVYTIVAELSDRAGNSTGGVEEFELDTHTLLDISSPADGSLYNYSKVTLEGSAEKGSNLTISGQVDAETLLIDPVSSQERILVDNCQLTGDPSHDGIKEVCKWRVDEFQLAKNGAGGSAATNPVEYFLTDPAGNTQAIDHTYLVDLYAVALSIDTDVEYFSPNGDGRQDGVDFIALSTDGQVDSWEIRISRQGELLPIRVLFGQSALPPNAYWNGRYDPADPESEGYVWAEDGEYTYLLWIKTTDQIEFQTLPVSLFARTSLDNEVVITYPKNNTVTVRGVTNVQGQAPVSTRVRICVNTIGLSASCDFEYFSDVDNNGSFSSIVPLVRLEDQVQTEHFISATASDEYGNETPRSNLVRVVVDNRDPFVSVTALPALTGVNNEEAYQVIIDKLDRGEVITEEDIAALRSVVLRSVVSQNTERVKLGYADYTNLSELPPELQMQYLGFIDQYIVDTPGRTGLYETYEDGVNPVFACEQTECTWDFYYPVPPVTGGVYEFEFNGKKGEMVTNVYASVMIDGTIPTAPIILDVNKLVSGESKNTNLFSRKYYSNGEILELIGAADSNMAIQVLDQARNLLCTTQTNSIGLFSCTSDVSVFYPDVDTDPVELALTVIATDGSNESRSLEDTLARIDKVPPEITLLTSTSAWRHPGQVAELTVSVNEPLWYGYLSTPEGTKHNYLLGPQQVGGSVAFTVPGNTVEGKHPTITTVADLAGNISSDLFEFFVDNTPPDSSAIVKEQNGTPWGTLNGVSALADTPATGRLTPEYTIRGNVLSIHGFAEKHSSVSLYADGQNVASVDVSENACETVSDDIVTADGVIVKYGEICEWGFEFQFTAEKGYTFAVKVTDRASNSSLIGEDEVVYYDKTVPMAPLISFMPITNQLEASVDGEAEALSDMQYWVYSPAGAEIDYRLFQNEGDGTYTTEFNLGDRVDTGGCVKMEGTRRIGTCQDGVYGFKVKSTDAAGNGSGLVTFGIERDTVSPAKPKVTLAIDGSNIVASISGEAYSSVRVNNKDSKFSLNSSGKTSATFIKYYSGETKYTFAVVLVDLAGNISEPTEVSIVTPATGQGEAAVSGAKDNNPWGLGKFNWDNQSVTVDLLLNQDGTYYFENIKMPKPELTYIDWDLNNYYFYGYGPYVNMPMVLNVYEAPYSRTYTLGEAFDECGVTTLEKVVYIPVDKLECTRGKMNISPIELNFLLVAKTITTGVKGNPIFHEKRIKGTAIGATDHALVHVYKNGAWQEAPNWPSWRVGGAAGSGGRFKVDWPIDQMANPDKVSVSVKVYGDGEVKMYDIQGNLIAPMNVRFDGLESPRSNEKTVPNTTIDGVTAVVLDVPYFNQYLEPDGTKKPSDGWKMCGAASAVMVAGYYDSLEYDLDDEYTLKKYEYSKSGQDWIKTKSCGGGAFGVTSGGSCSSSTPDGIMKYTLGQSERKYAFINKLEFTTIKYSIDQKRPVFVDIGDDLAKKGDSFGHILLVIGYTSDGRLIVNDPYTNLEKYGRDWVDYSSGHAVVYEYNSERWFPKWYLF